MKKILLISLLNLAVLNNNAFCQESLYSNKIDTYTQTNLNNKKNNNLDNKNNNLNFFGGSLEKPSAVTYANTVEMADFNQIKKWLDNKIIKVNYDGSRIGQGLHIATWIGNLELMQLFLDYGADINSLNRNGETPLAIAAFRGNKSAFDFLIKKGAKVNLQEELQWSPLHYAAFNGHIELAKELVQKYNADINARSPNGSTPLMFAVYENQTQMAEELLNLGADKNYINDRKESAFVWAMRKDNIALARKLATNDDFLITMNRPATFWKPLSNSLQQSTELNKLLTLKNKLLAKDKNADVSKITAQIDKEKHRIIDKLFNKKSTQKVNTLQIISSRKEPNNQKIQLTN